MVLVQNFCQPNVYEIISCFNFTLIVIVKLNAFSWAYWPFRFLFFFLVNHLLHLSSTFLLDCFPFNFGNFLDINFLLAIYMVNII